MLKFIHLKAGEKMIHESLKKDFSEIADMEGLEQFRNKTFLITGATGLLGSLLIKFFIYLNRTQNLEIKIYGTVRNFDKAKSYFAGYDCDSINFVLLDFLDDKKIETLEIKGDIDYIIHTAAVTTSKQMVKTPVETLLGAIQGTKCMLKLAKEKRVKKIIYVLAIQREKEHVNVYVKAIMQNMEFLQFKYVLHKPLVRAYIMEKIGFLHNLHEVQ